MAGYEYLGDSDLTEENLLKDEEFLYDASQHILDRTGEEYFDPEDIYDNWNELMRSGVVNEVSMYRDLEYAQNGTDEQKSRFARLLDTFERKDAEYTLDMVGDYGAAAITAPSTLASIGAGFVTGGVGTVAGKTTAIAGAQAGRKALSQMLKEFAFKPTIKQGIARGAAVEAPLAMIGTDVQQRTREEVGMERQEGAVAIAGIAGGVLGAVGGGIGAALAKKQVAKASQLAETAQKAVELRKTAQRTIIKTEKEKLRRLNPELVEEGERILNDINKNSPLAAKLDKETIEATVAAAMKLGSKIKRKPGQRITEAIAEAIMEGKLSVDEINAVKKEFKLTDGQFAAVYTADISDAARKLGKQSQLMRRLSELSETDPQHNALARSGITDLTDKELMDEVGKHGRFYNMMRSADRLRLGLMTSQLATTVRNTIGGGFRLATDALDTAFMNVSDRIRGKTTTAEAFKSVFSTGRYFFNQKEARVIQEIFQDNMPDQARKLFFSAAEAEARGGSNNLAGKIGNAVNVANTWSDGLFKRAMFASTLDRQLRKTGTTLNQVVARGDFNLIDDTMIKNAVEESLHFAYQQNPKMTTKIGRAGNSLIEAHRELPFVISTFIPFPRFVMNQLKFVTEHMPGLGSLTRRMSGEPVSTEEFAKQLTGGTLLIAATQFRAQQDSDLKWNEIRDSRGVTTDMAAVYGPFAPYMIMGDYIARATKGEPIDSLAKYMGETFKALGTPRFKGDFGLLPIDRMWEDLSDGKFKRAAGKLVGDVLGTYTIPIAMVKDIHSAYDRDARFIEDFDTVLDSSDGGFTGDFIDIFRYAAHYSSKYMPNWDGIDPNKRRYSVTAGRLEKINPIEKHLFGFTRYKPKTVLESEMDRLQIDRYKLYKRDPDPIRNAINQFVLGSKMPSAMEAVIQSKEYAKLDDIEKAATLRSEYQRIATSIGVKEYGDQLMEDLVGTDKTFSYRQVFREAFEELPKERRRLLERDWKEAKEYNGMSINEAGAYHWAIERNRAYGKMRL